MDPLRRAFPVSDDVGKCDGHSAGQKEIASRPVKSNLANHMLLLGERVLLAVPNEVDMLRQSVFWTA
jgi:hypothetical protein